MSFSEYISIPSDATKPGAPVDAFLLESLRANGLIDQKHFATSLASPFGPNGAFVPGGTPNVISISGPITEAHRTFCYNAQKITLNTNMDTKAMVPLVWFATEEIHLKANIDASGKGAAIGKKGNFGGSGGGRNGTAAEACVMPITEVELAAGGAGPAGPGANGTQLDEHWASRLFMHMAGATGGGPGGGASAGAGGGVVVLCAPKITIDGGMHIHAKGADGVAGVGGHGDGGGGGGLIILIAKEFSPPASPPGTLNVDGGSGATPAGKDAGGDGGAGRIFRIKYE